MISTTKMRKCLPKLDDSLREVLFVALQLVGVLHGTTDCFSPGSSPNDNSVCLHTAIKEKNGKLVMSAIKAEMMVLCSQAWWSVVLHPVHTGTLVLLK